MEKGNAYTGDVPLSIKGWPRLTLRFDWDAVAAVQSSFGEKTLAALMGSDTQTLLELAAIGLRRHHPDITAETLRTFPTAVLPLKIKVVEALTLAHEGPGAERKSTANPQNRAVRRAAARIAKKTRSKRRS